jgi:S-formylglutathione hydrolase FrmB
LDLLVAGVAVLGAGLALAGFEWSVATARADVLAPVCDAPSTFAGSPRVVSGSLDGVKFNVLLPTDYTTSTRVYPTLYLLNGATQDQNAWLAQSDLLAFTARMPADQAAIVVMPYGDRLGADIDWRDGSHLWETIYIKRLLPYIDAHFRTLADRSHRAIGGLSAGGFTAMHDAARHPDLFVAAGSFSGLVDFALHNPPGDPAAILPLERLDNACSGGQPTTFGIAGDPVRDDVFWHNVNPPDMAENLGGVTLYVASGNGVPCDARDVEDSVAGGPLSFLESEILVSSQSFDRALSDARVAHRNDFYGCGTHTYRYFQRDLHAFWPQMIKAFGTPPPQSFDYRTADPGFTVWGWTFTADPKRATEFLDIHRASPAGLTITGSGTETVTTAPMFTAGQRVEVTGTGRRPNTVTADTSGRISFHVDLGRPHHAQQYTLAARISGEDRPGYFTTRTVTFHPRRAARGIS